MCGIGEGRYALLRPEYTGSIGTGEIGLPDIANTVFAHRRYESVKARLPKKDIGALLWNGRLLRELRQMVRAKPGQY